MKYLNERISLVILIITAIIFLKNSIITAPIFFITIILIFIADELIDIKCAIDKKGDNK